MNVTAVRRAQARARAIAIAACGAFLLAACVGSDEARGVGQAFPAVRLPLLDVKGELALPGREPTIVNVWATWCEPCRREMQSLERLHRAAPGGVRVVGISVDTDANLAAEFVRSEKLTFTNALDARFELTEGALRVDRFPTTFVIDARGVVRLREERARDWSDAANVERVKALLAP
jgi:thiol-disulfide isomerase/thioredoxin